MLRARKGPIERQSMHRPQSDDNRASPMHFSQTQGCSGILLARSTGTAATLFCGDPSMTRSE